MVMFAQDSGVARLCVGQAREIRGYGLCKFAALNIILEVRG